MECKAPIRIGFAGASMAQQTISVRTVLIDTMFPKSETEFADQKVLSVPEVSEGDARCYHNLRKKQTERTVLINTVHATEIINLLQRTAGLQSQKEILKIKMKREVL